MPRHKKTAPASTTAPSPAPANAAGRVPLGVLALGVVKQWRETPDGLVLLVDSERRAERLASIVFALDRTTDVLVLPRWDRLPYEHIPPSREVMGRRASVLRRLSESAKPLLITTPDATLQRLPPRAVWSGATVSFQVGDALDLADFAGQLRALSYAQVPEVDEPGEVAPRGQVLDIFPAGALGPLRIETVNGAITSIARFDLATQRTNGDTSSVVLDAASELVGDLATLETDVRPDNVEASMLTLYPSPETIADYLSRAAWLSDGDIAAAAQGWFTQIAAARPSRSEKDDGARSAAKRFYLTQTEWKSIAARAEPIAPLLPATQPVPSFALERNGKQAFARFIKAEAVADRRIVLVAADVDDLARMEEIAHRQKLTTDRVQNWDDAVVPNGAACRGVFADLDEGFVLADEPATVVAAADLLGSRARHATPFDARATAITEEATLRFGDAILHLEHGVGLLRDLETINTPGSADRDVVRIEYAGETDMLAPVNELGMVWRYSGDPDAIKLDKLSGETWRKRRRDVEADIERTAKALIEIADNRTERDAPVLRPPPAEYERFVSGFAFNETPDQASAIEDVLRDLESGTPMDRLICGDVGFGKTEVALRAAAAVVLAGKQVAIVAPTTVLVRQHVETFAKRFAALGIEVAHVSRLVKPAELCKTREGLKSGAIRLVIGTHALAGKDIAFADLGLVVIDEEQRFGTRDKEKVRSLAERCHLLVMTATPIPRTLMAARVGLQSLSLLATPPARRIPVRTVITPLDDAVLQDAITQERQRNGQTFLVCPRIEDIPAVADRLRSLLPDVTVTVVHGKLPPEEVDEAIVRFANGEGDVLLATNIIESGLDVPRANTILITKPDRFGLAQLHQLRGRVGRGARRGKAFLLVSDPVAKSARKRLDAFSELEGVGVGFEISAQDMDQRGAGDLLGEEQAGHVKLLGADLHRHLLERAIQQARGERTVEEWKPHINMAADGCFPASFIGDAELRLNMYARLSRLRSDAEVASFRDELEDRFGALPGEAEHLLSRTLLELRCRDQGIMRVDAGPRGTALAFLTADHRPTTLPVGAEWKGERLLIPPTADDGDAAGSLMRLLETIAKR